METLKTEEGQPDPIKALRGIGRGEGLLEVLLRRRREERVVNLPTVPPSPATTD